MGDQWSTNCRPLIAHFGPQRRPTTFVHGRPIMVGRSWSDFPTPATSPTKSTNPNLTLLRKLTHTLTQTLTLNLTPFLTLTLTRTNWFRPLIAFFSCIWYCSVDLGTRSIVLVGQYICAYIICQNVKKLVKTGPPKFYRLFTDSFVVSCFYFLKS